VGYRHDIAAVVEVNTVTAQLSPKAGKAFSSGVVDRNRSFSHYAITKNDIAVHVVLVECLGIFIGDKGSEAAVRGAVVVVLRSALNIVPRFLFSPIAVGEGAGKGFLGEVL